MPHPRPFANRRRSGTLAAVVLLSGFWFAGVASVARKSMVFDELFFLTGGYSYWRTGDYRIHPTNGNLIQRYLALPLVATRARMPSRDQPAWWHPAFFGIAFGRQLCFEAGNAIDDLLLTARGLNALLGVALGGLVFGWSRKLFGTPGAFVSVALFALCPTVTAHSGLATADIASALGFLAATAAFWATLQRLAPPRVLATGIAAGGLALTKFSAPLLVPIFLVLLTLRVVRRRPWPCSVWGVRGALTTRRSRALAGAASLVTIGIIVVALVWSAYGFRFSGMAHPEPGRDRWDTPWEVILGGEQNSRIKSLIGGARKAHLLPEAFLYGMGHTVRFSEQRPAYLQGKVSTTGWRWFFPYAFAVKTTLPALLLLALAGLSGARSLGTPGSARIALYRVSPLLTLLAVYWGAALSSNLDLGIRHLMPVYPAAFILAGSVGRHLTRRPVAAIVGILLLWHGVENLRNYPDRIAYFNQLAGGTAGGRWHLVDNSLDWGQDLPSVAEWMQGRHHDTVVLSYFGTALPSHYGVYAPDLLTLLRSSLRPDRLAALPAGEYVIGFTTWAGPNEPYPRWTSEVETYYRRILDYVVTHRAQAGFEASAEWAQARVLIAQLQMDRMLAMLRGRSPGETIHGSLGVWRLSADDIEHAAFGPVHEVTERSPVP